MILDNLVVGYRLWDSKSTKLLGFGCYLLDGFESKLFRIIGLLYDLSMLFEFSQKVLGERDLHDLLSSI